MVPTSPQERLKQFFYAGQVRTVPQDFCLITGDADPQDVYFLEKGIVKSEVFGSGGQNIILHLFTPGSFFPLTQAIGKIPNRFWYYALKKTTLYTRSKQEFMAFIETDPQVLLFLLRRFLNALDKLTLRIEQLSMEHVSARLASVLLYLGRHFGKESEGIVFLTEHFTHSELASLVGTTRETVSREWKKLEKNGAIGAKGKEILLYPTKLNEFLAKAHRG